VQTALVEAVDTSPTHPDESGREVANLFELYGAVDEQVEGDKLTPEDRDVLLRILPVYRRADAHWFRDFAKTTRLAEKWKIAEPKTRVGTALTGIAKIKPRGRLRARRLFAVAVAAQAFPELPARLLASAVLGPGELPEGEEGDARAQKLKALLRRGPDSDDSDGRDAWFDGLRQSAPDGIGARPCSGTLAWVKVNGDRDLVPTLKTVFNAYIPFDDARQFCDDPTTWECFPTWCSMKKLNEANWKNGIRQYQEVVSFDCHTVAFPKLTINLNFHMEEDVYTEGVTPRRRVLTEYWLSDDQPPDPPVRVNQGWLEIVELSKDPCPEVRVTTTKSVMFRDDLGGPGLASLSCRLGYMSMVGDLITCASKPREQKGYPDVEDRARKPPEDAQGTARTPDMEIGGLISMMVDETGAAVEECIDEYVKASKASYATFESGYTADDLVRDTSDAWLRMVRQGARFADMGLRVARTAPGASDRRPARATKRTRGKS
jgi:hypothetical protein